MRRAATGRTDLIKNGVLSGCLSNWYETPAPAARRALEAKLGARGPAAEAALVPPQRLSLRRRRRAPVRQPARRRASNVVLEGARPVAFDDLVRRIGDGLYIGRIWYTYPINGLRAGDFTCTVVGDSYIIATDESWRR